MQAHILTAGAERDIPLARAAEMQETGPEERKRGEQQNGKRIDSAGEFRQLDGRILH